METKNKILLVEQDPNISFKICIALKNSGYEVTDVVPFVFNAIKSMEAIKPDVIMIDAIITAPLADFVSEYLNIPAIIITSQTEAEICKFSEKIKILSYVYKPFNFEMLKVSTAIAFNKF